MATSRRRFLTQTAIAGASAALNRVPILEVATPKSGAESVHTALHTGSARNEFTRGIGVYPGDPREDFSPELITDAVTYRNLAYHRPAYHSSSYDYNLTAQLITDGIKDTHLPDWVTVSTSSRGALPKNERELVIDHSRTNSIELYGAQPNVQIQLAGSEIVPEVDRVDIVVIPPVQNPSQLNFSVSVSDDGRQWQKVGSVAAPQPVSVEGYPPDFARPGMLFIPSISLHRPCRSRFYQVECALAHAPERSFYMQWRLGEIEFYRNDQRVQIGGPYSFTSAWMSAGLGEEWVYVDLGARCAIDRVKLYWIARAADGAVQISDDSEHWHDLHTFADATGQLDDVKLAQPAHGHYVRVLMKRPTSPDGYILSEMEVYGRGGPVARPKRALPEKGGDGESRMDLAGNPWRLQRASLVSGDGPDLSKAGFDDHDWLLATVPGTTLTSYLNVQAIPDPNIGKNQLYVSDSYFYSDFWYRTEFAAPEIAPGQTAWLNFDGINWKAGVFLNGSEIGRIEGAFTRGRFDVTDKLLPGKTNVLAVLIEKNATPGSCKQKTFENGGPNGGALGADNPTYHASVGWDWIPTIRGRNTGIVGEVYLTTTGAVSIENPFINASLPLPDVSRADLSIEIDLVNHSSSPLNGILRGRFGDAQFEQSVSLGASGSNSGHTHIKVDPSTHQALRLQSPKLWWPVGYGEPYLYDVELMFEIGGKKSDTHKLTYGIRQMTFSEDGGALKVWINGRRFIPRGGNWGFSEAMLRYRAREYNAALRYHREMNFNMIRNWVGQVGDNAFYDACDHYGVLVWQDFWLANPWDGPNPDDNELFLGNAKDTVRRIRNHACIGLYCGRNEGYPPKPIEDGLEGAVRDLHPGLHYIPSSADGVVGGGGPYMLMPLTYYPANAAYDKLHSEIGIPNIPNSESVRMFLSPSGLWPPGLEWGLHDLPEGGGFRRGPTFFDTIEDAYGGTQDFEEWVSLAHFADCEGFRAEFEAQSKNRMGLLLWMSHSCWPSLLWQTYDYYLDPTPAYFVCKKVCEPLHIQWNRVTDEVEVVNYSADNLHGLTAVAEVLNIDGSVKWSKAATLDSAEDSTMTCLAMQYPDGLTPVHFVRLTLSRGGSPVSTNLYMRGIQQGNFRAIRQLPKAHLQTSTKVVRQGEAWALTTTLKNVSPTTALMVKLKAVREKTGDRILPVIYQDNYFTLFPGEQHVIQTEVNHADTRGENPRMVVSGYNVKSVG